MAKPRKPFIPPVPTFDHFGHGAAVAAEAAGDAHGVRSPARDGQVIEARHDQIRPSALNPRKHFDEEGLAELAASIQKSGLLQNLVVRPIEGGRFELIAGERRWRAIGRLIAAGSWAEDTPIAVRVVDAFDDHEARVLAIIENLQRKDIAPLEEGRAMLALKAGGMAVPDIAQAIGMSRRLVETRIALVTRLVPEAQAALDAGTINLNQARELLPAAPEVQRAMTKKLAAPDAPTYVTAVSAIRSEVRRELVPVDRAIFDVDTSGIEVVEDLDGQRMLPRSAFLAAQKAAVEARLEVLKREYAGAELRTWFNPIGWDTAKDMGRSEREGTAIIVMDGGGTVAEYLGLFDPAARHKAKREQDLAEWAVKQNELEAHAARLQTRIEEALAADGTRAVAMLVACALTSYWGKLETNHPDAAAPVWDLLGWRPNNDATSNEDFVAIFRAAAAKSPLRLLDFMREWGRHTLRVRPARQMTNDDIALLSALGIDAASV